MRVLKRRYFARWQVREGLSDAVLCKAAKAWERGLIEADLGGLLYKLRVARPGAGKSGGYRTLVSARIGDRLVFRPISGPMNAMLCVIPAGSFSIYPVSRWPWPCAPAFCKRCVVTSQVIESLREDLSALHDTGAIGKLTMRQFDSICPPPVREFSAGDIRRLREALRFSQPVFAHHLHTTASTVRKWEQGDTRPTGPALKLLNIIADKGLQVLL